MDAAWAATVAAHQRTGRLAMTGNDGDAGKLVKVSCSACGKRLNVCENWGTTKCPGCRAEIDVAPLLAAEEDRTAPRQAVACPHCGKPCGIRTDIGGGKCPYCGQTFSLDEAKRWGRRSLASAESLGAVGAVMVILAILACIAERLLAGAKDEPMPSSLGYAIFICAGIIVCGLASMGRVLNRIADKLDRIDRRD